MSRAYSALIVIDVQNDYFETGAFPLWQAEACLERIEQAISRARAAGMPVVLVQHVVDAGGAGPFFNKGTPGAEIHGRVRAAAPEAPIVTKEQADSFLGTNLEELLASLGVTKLIITGMMTHNCVTHTAISKAAEKYEVTTVGECCATVTEIVHLLALAALGARSKVATLDEALPAVAQQ